MRPFTFHCTSSILDRRHRESARHDEQEPGRQMSRAGLSEPDFMARQRYLENSRYRNVFFL